MLAANFPAPTIALKEGQEFYLTLTNVGHGERGRTCSTRTRCTSTASPTPRRSSTACRKAPSPSTWARASPTTTTSSSRAPSCTTATWRPPSTCRWACWATSTSTRQNRTGTAARSQARRATGARKRATPSYAYNDGDGSTGYDVEVPIQLGSFDPDFHDASITVQPLPFADDEGQVRHDQRPRLSGHGQPGTAEPAGEPGHRPRSGQGVAEGEFPGHRHGGAEDPAAPLQPQRHQLLHRHGAGPADEGGGQAAPASCAAPTARTSTTTPAR